MKDVALIFPGQGAQTVGMGREFYETSSAAKQIFEQADEIIAGLSDVIFNGPAEKLTSTAFCQPAIFTMSVAALAALREHTQFQNITVKFSCGLSLGEYPALVACGALEFDATLKLVERRSSFMDEATQLEKGAMSAVIGFDRDKIEAICTETGAEVANYNSPDQIVITGIAQKVEAASVKIKEAGAKRVIALDVSGAFHSTLMAPAAEKFKEELETIELAEPQYPIIGNVNGVPTSDPSEIKANLASQITSSVQWVKTVEHIVSEKIDTFIEIGPGTVLKGLIRKIDRTLTVHNIQKPEDIEALEFD